MSENLIAYWRNWIQSEKELKVTKDGYIFKFTIINQHSNEGVMDWVCCSSNQKLYAFIKYVILPSIQVSRSVGMKPAKVYFDAVDSDDVIGIFENYNGDNKHEAINTFKRWFSVISELEKNDAPFDEVSKYIDSICSEVDYREGIFVDIQLFLNISQVGKTLIKEYEEDDMIDVLENEMKLNKEEIEELFNNINDNKFMLNKITTLLNERFGI